MIITDRCVYIHMPKTGGTFTTHVLMHLHQLPHSMALGARLRRRLMKTLGSPTVAGAPTKYGPIMDCEPKHGTCHAIPAAHRNKPIFSTLRSPFEWYVSQYEFGWWTRTFMYHPEKHPTPAGAALEEALPAFQTTHPHFPNLRFDEFVDLCCDAAAKYDIEGRPSVGLYTHTFFRFFFYDPNRALALLDPSYLTSKRYREDMFNVDFVMTSNLRQQLSQYLLRLGYEQADLDFIGGLGRILPQGRGRREDQDWRSYYDQHLLSRVRQIDWPVLTIFPELAA